MSDKLDKTFNITPVEVSTTPENGCSTKKDQLTNVTKSNKPDRLTKDDITRDYEYTRGNLYSIIEKVKKQLMAFLRLLKRVKCLEHMKLLVS